MAVPKKRTSKSKKNKRKETWKRKVKTYGLTVPFTMEFHQVVFVPWKTERDKKTVFKGFQKTSFQTSLKGENSNENL